MQPKDPRNPTTHRPIRVSRYIAPKFFPGPAGFFLTVGSLIYIHNSTQPFALDTRRVIENALGRYFLKASGMAIVGIHTVEAIYILSQCVKYHCSFTTSVKYIGTTLLLGYASMKEFNLQVKKAEEDTAKDV